MILEKHFGEDWKNTCKKIIYIGDDTTDEDAMKQLAGIAKTFRVSELPNLKTYGNYQLKTPDDVAYVLKWLQSNYEKKKKNWGHNFKNRKKIQKIYFRFSIYF